MIARLFRSESAARMRRRIQRGSFWRSVFWQGEHGGAPGHDRLGLDPQVVPHLQYELLNNIKQRGIAL